MRASAEGCCSTPTSWRFSRGAAPPSRIVLGHLWLLAGYVVGVALVVTVVAVVAVQLVGLAEEPQAGPVVAAAAGLVGVLVATRWMASRHFELGPVAWDAGVGSVTVACVLALGVTRPALAGWAIGLVFATFFLTTLVVVKTDATAAHGDPAAQRLWHRLIWIYAVAALAMPWLIGGSGGTSTVEVLVGFILGIANSVGFYLVVGSLLAVVYFRSALTIAGERDPWRRRFLRFAADRSLLTLVDGEYRFVHLLVRDHLAACDPVSLAEAVLRRRAELSEE
jgi:hypothetical protein